MNQEIVTISFHELCQLEGVETDVMIEIVECGIVQPVEGEETVDWVFDATSTHWIKKAVRIYQDLEIDWVAVALVIDLMRQKEFLEKESKRYQRQLGRFVENQARYR